MLERDRMRLPFVVFLLLLAGCSVPKGDQGPIGPTGKTGQDGLTDHQFRISFPSASAATSDTVGSVLPATSFVIAFNMANYVN